MKSSQASLPVCAWPCLACLSAAGLTMTPQATGPASIHRCPWLEGCKVPYGLSMTLSAILLRRRVWGRLQSSTATPRGAARQAAATPEPPPPVSPDEHTGWVSPGRAGATPAPLLSTVTCQALCRCPSQGPLRTPSPEPVAPTGTWAGGALVPQPAAGPPAVSPPVPPAGG